MDDFNVADEVSVDNAAETAKQISSIKHKLRTLCWIIGKIP